MFIKCIVGVRGVRSLIFSSPTPLLCFKNWLLLLDDSWLHNRLLILYNSCHKSRKVQKDINISKILWLKITPASAPVPIKNIHSWFCSCSGWKALTHAEVDSCTPDPSHLWLVYYRDGHRAGTDRIRSLATFLVSGFEFLGKTGFGPGPGFSMYGMMYIKCMRKHGRNGHRAGSGFGVKNLEANQFRSRIRILSLRRRLESIFLTPPISGALHFLIRTGKFWVEAGCSWLLKDFNPQLCDTSIAAVILFTI